MRSDVDAANPQRLTETMRRLLMHNALHHRGDAIFDSLSPMNAAALEAVGVLSISKESQKLDELRDILTSRDHPKRVPAPAGPFVFIRSTEEDDTIAAMAPAALLAEAAADLRVAALQYFQELPTGYIASRTRLQLEQARDQIRSDAREQWLPAAQGVYDLLHNDLYLTIAGFRQGYELNYPEEVEEYLPRILRPDAPLLASVEVAYWNPSGSREEIEKAVRNLSAAPSLTEAIAGYYREFGHIPLAGSLSMGELLRLWLLSQPKNGTWDLLWKWADSQTSPLPRYHVCCALLANLDLVPMGSEQVLWSEIADIVGTGREPGGEPESREAWRLREDFAAHFGAYLECLVPGLPSEQVMVMTWWLTERLCEVFPASPGLLKKIRESTAANEQKRSGFINNLTHPPVEPSTFRYLTQVHHKSWTAATVAELAKAGPLAERAQPEKARGLRLEEAILTCLIRGLPAVEARVVNPIYSFDQPLAPTVEMWKSLRDFEQEKRAEMSALCESARWFSAESSLDQIVERLAKEDGDDNAGVENARAAEALKLRAYTDAGSGKTLWTLLESKSRWAGILRKSDDRVVSPFFEALIELSVRDGDPWRAAVPHMIAATAEKEQDAERRQVFFGLVLFASLSLGTTSAVDRLMHDSLRQEFSVFSSRWRDTLKSTLAAAPPWAAARIRSVLPHLVLDPLPGSDME
jgi:hypothetical protein